MPPSHGSPFWLLEMKCKNNTRSCVPTCLAEYSAIIANSRILQPLQPAAAPLPSGSYGLFHRISRRVFWLFSITQVLRQRAIIPTFFFNKKPYWDMGCGNRLCNFLPIQIKEFISNHQTLRALCAYTSAGSVNALFLHTMLLSIHLWQRSQCNM